MNVKNFERKDNSKAEITVEFTAVEFEKALNDAFQKGKDMIQIPGFRKGKAPRVMVERMYGAKIFYEDALEELFPQGLDYAVAENNITIVGQPAVVNFDVSDEKVAEINLAHNHAKGRHNYIGYHGRNNFTESTADDNADC